MSQLSCSSRSRRRRAFWLKHLYRWHWISSAACLAGMLLFAVTGITLNHAAHIESRPEVTSREARLPANLLAEIAPGPRPRKARLPAAVRDWLGQEMSVHAGDAEAEWSKDEVYVALCALIARRHRRRHRRASGAGPRRASS